MVVVDKFALSTQTGQRELALAGRHSQHRHTVCCRGCVDASVATVFFASPEAKRPLILLSGDETHPYPTLAAGAKTPGTGSGKSSSASGGTFAGPHRTRFQAQTTDGFHRTCRDCDLHIPAASAGIPFHVGVVGVGSCSWCTSQRFFCWSNCLWTW